MVTVNAARKTALSLPEVEEKKHFNTPDFRVNNKIFASLHEDKRLMMVRLSLADQFAFCSYNKEIIYTVPGGWGNKGATFIDLRKIKMSILKDALKIAWKYTAPARLVKKYSGLI